MNEPTINLYTWVTPNGWKASCTLEELAIPFDVTPIDITKASRRPRLNRALNPNGRIPVFVDRSAGGFTILEIRRDHDLSRGDGGPAASDRSQGAF